MGNYAIILALAGVVMVSVMSLNAREGIQESNEPLENHHFKSVAREASMTGLNWTVRQLVADTASWKTKLSINPETYGTGDEPKPYHHATFQTKVLGHYDTPVVQGFCNPDTVDVASIGRAFAGKEHRHEVVATYVRTCSDPGSQPLFPDYPLIAEDLLSMTDDARIFAGDPSGNTDIHSNDRIWIEGKAKIEGYGTQSSRQTGESGCKEGGCFVPNAPVDGRDPFEADAPTIEIPELVFDDWLPRASLLTTTSEVRFEKTNGVINFADFPSTWGSPKQDPTLGTAGNPFIWLVDGDMLMNEANIEFRGHGMIIVSGGVKINSDAQIYTALTEGTPAPPVDNEGRPNRNNDAMETWIKDYLPGGAPFGLFAAGCYDNNCDSNYGIHIDAKSTVVGQLFANHQLSFNDEATVIGALATRGDMLIEGKVEVHYLPASESIGGGGNGVELPDGIRLLSLVEF